MPSRLLEGLAAIAVGLVIGLAVYAVWLSNSDDPERAADLGAATSVSTLPIRGPLDPSELVAAYERSRLATFALDAELERARGDTINRTRVRQARLGDRALDEVGARAFVRADGELRRCERLEGEVLCTPPEPAPTVEEEVRVFSTLVDGDLSRYEIYNDTNDPKEEFAGIDVPADVVVRCWTLLATGLAAGGYGAETTLCFDQATGALVLSRTRTDTAIDTLIPLELRADVTSGDLDPTR